MHMPKQLPTTLGSTASFTVQCYLAETNEFAVARSTDGKIGVTWNDTAHPGGYPKAFGHQQWFELPEPLALRTWSDAVTAAMLDGQ